jgi:hypothetical protein
VRRQRILDASGHAGARRLMGYSFDPTAPDQLPEKRQIEDGTPTKVKSRIVHQGLDIFKFPRAKVIQNGHLVTQR